MSSTSRSGARTRVSSTGAIQKKGTKPIACQRCHSRKVKCSGGQPCVGCRDADKDCVYPSRDRQVQVSQQYVEDLLKENERLRAASIQLDTVAAPDPPFQALQGPSSTRDIAATQDNLQYPLLEDRPWFHPISSLDMPIHISEAADASFATRFRQTLGNVHTNHIPRMSYVTDERLLLLSDQECPWPTSARARFLVKVALNTFCRYYHIVRRSIVLENLELAIKNQGRGDRLHICRLLALFALGELYSTKTAARDGSFPGLDYFARATKMAGVPAERPRMDAIEIILLLVVYSYAMNRRHSAYSFSTSAIRLGTIMGMHLNIPDQQYGDRQAREHRIRVWWTAYILDRTCASKVGLPVSIREDTIHVDLPNSGDFGDDFGDAEYMLRSIELAKLAAQSIRSIYSRRKHESSFSQRVQLSLKDFTRWMESLPHHLQIGERNAASVSPHNVLYLHLTFNQCVILGTRPILLHILRCHKELWTENNTSISKQPDVPDSALALAETCIKCARHSYRLLSEGWIHGSFAIFDYFNTQYLFSVATILAVSSLLGSSHSQSDEDKFSNAAEILEQLDQSGNYGAKEFCQHLDAMKKSMAIANELRGRESQMASASLSTDVTEQETPLSYTGSGITAGMALAEPLLQEFLAETDLNLQLFDVPSSEGLQTPFWPELWGDGWTAG